MRFEVVNTRLQPVVLRPRHPLPKWMLRAWELFAPRIPRWAQRRIGRFFLRFPPGSRPRRWFLVRLSQVAWDATARTRFDLVLPIWDADCAWHWDSTAQTLGFDEVYRGHQGVERSLAQFNDAWTDRSVVIRELLDGGEALVIRLTLFGRGAYSGVPTEANITAVVRLNPFIFDYYNFMDDEEALREAGFVGARPTPPARSRRC